MMRGLMQSWPLTVDKFLTHARAWHGDREVVTRSVEGAIVRTTYAQIYARAKRLSNALLDLGVRSGERVGTLAWNTARHLETWYGIMGIGAVCHTLNPRLFPEQLCYIINHARDRLIFTDLTFAPLLASCLDRLPGVEHVIVMTDDDHMIEIPRGIAYERLLQAQDADCAWGEFDEQAACGLCYTSGTTGNPKGVLYSHRSNYLHTLIALQTDVLGISVRDVVLPVVPMYHANAWGIGFAAPAAGAKLVMPGAKMDGASIFDLMESEGVTFAAAVPTVWQMLLQHMQATDCRPSTLKRAVVGGSACPEVLIRAFRDQYGVEVVHAWGMTETSPIGTIGALPPSISALPLDQQMRFRVKQGRPVLGVELKLTDDDDESLPHDGVTCGHLKIRGATVAAAYLDGPRNENLDADGFFDTGDIATIDGDGFLQITDRAKDVIKSGGEWISSIEIENIAAGHPKVALAAVIGIPHPQWSERPLLIVKLKPSETATRAELLEFLTGKIAKWWLPDEVLFVEQIPLGATGKIDKKALRASTRATSGSSIIPPACDT